MKQPSKEYASIFQLDGIPKFSQALPLALQHVVAMIVGCVTPAIIVSNVANLSTADRVILIQAALVVSALSTLLQLFPIGKRTGSISEPLCRLSWASASLTCPACSPSQRTTAFLLF